MAGLDEPRFVGAVAEPAVEPAGPELSFELEDPPRELAEGAVMEMMSES